MTSETVLRFGVLGCGRMGRRRMELLEGHPNTELVSVSDLHADSAARAAADHGCPQRQSVEEMLEHDALDGIFVSLPNKFHVDPAVAALDAGAHVFCEKPLASDPAGARALVKAELASASTLRVGANLRFFPNVLAAKQLLSAGTIGEPLFVRGWIGHDGWNLGGSWFSDPELSGGGTFLDNGVHVFDLVRWLVGEARTALGHVQTDLWSIEPMEDNGFGIFQLESGATAVLQASWTEWAGYMYMEIYGADGFLRIDNRGGNSTLQLGRRTGDVETVNVPDEGVPSYKVEFDSYIDDLLHRRASSPNAFDGLRAVEMACGVYEAARTGRRQEIWTDEDARLLEAYGGRVADYDAVETSVGVASADEAVPTTVLARLHEHVHAALRQTQCLANELPAGQVPRAAWANVARLLPPPRPPAALDVAAKRAVDVLVAAGALVLLAPVILLLALLVRLETPGPALFGDERLTRGGRRFRCWKLRSMRVDGQSQLGSHEDLWHFYLENDFKMPVDADPRVTTVGRLMRRFRLDEIPQLWNVLRGELSLVGPRPVKELEASAWYGPLATELLSVRPGITGVWQISGGASYPERIWIELRYARTRSFLGDLAILVWTLVRLRAPAAHHVVAAGSSRGTQPDTGAVAEAEPAP